MPHAGRHRQKSSPQTTRLAHEYKVVRVRACPLPSSRPACENARDAVHYWRKHIASAEWYSPDKENLVVIMLDNRRQIKGHYIVTIGTLDTGLVHAREVFRPALIGACSGIIIGHNHPTGNPTPSPDDVQLTRQLVQAGEILQIPLLDHIVIGHHHHVSLKDLGHL